MSRYGKVISKYLERVRKGDKSKLGKVFDLTANHLRKVAAYYLTDKSYCDDVVSDAFCRALRYINSFDKKQDGYNWLCKIVETTAFTYNKSEGERAAKTVPLEDIDDVGKEPKERGTKVDITAAMQILTPQNKEIIYDYFFLGYTYEEIGAKNHIVKSAVYKRIQTSFKKMADFLKNGEQNKSKKVYNNRQKQKEKEL